MKNIFVIITIIYLILVPTALSDVLINEIMYNPDQCDDDYCEWIELYNFGNESVNLTSWSLCEKELLPGYVNKSDGQTYFDNDSSILSPGTYAIITDGGSGSLVYDNFNISNTSLSLHVDASSICSYLSDLGEEINLSNNLGEIIDSIDYDPTIGADGNNYSLELREDGSWGESVIMGGTIGNENSIYSFSDDFSELRINEFLADPEGDDNLDKPNGEWIELFNEGASSLDLRGLILTDKNFENELYISDTKVLSDSGTIIGPGEYLVIYRDGDSDFALNNNGYDEVNLYTVDEELIDSVSYSDSTQEMSWSYIEDDWMLTPITPEEENEYVEGCDWQLNLDLENNIFQEDDLEFNVTVERLVGQGETLTVKGTIENLFGEVIKNYSPWTHKEIETSNTKSYSPNLDEGSYQISFWIDDISCEDFDSSNNIIEELIAINPQYLVNDSSLEIVTLYLGSDNTAEWGDMFRTNVIIYKGQETKYSISLWVEVNGERVSRETKLNIYEQYQNYTLTVPIQLEPNCDGSIDDGDATLHLEGLGLEKSTTFEIEGIDSEICTDYFDYVDDLEDDESDNSSNSDETYQIIDLPETLEPGQEFNITLQVLGDDGSHDYSAWAYVYSGSRCYSCLEKTIEREDNLQEFTVDSNDLFLTEFELILDEDMSDGDYKLKVKILKDDQVTEKEVTEGIVVESKVSSSNDSLETSVSLLSGGLEENSFSELSSSNFSISDVGNFAGMIVYESSSEKAKKLAPYFLIGAILILLVIIFNKKI